MNLHRHLLLWPLLAACSAAPSGPDPDTASQAEPVVAADSAVNGISYSSSSIIAGGYGHNCMLGRDGTVLCGGLNSVGQLGDGSTTNRPIPVQVANLGQQTSVAAGGFHSCSIDVTGNAHCWGSNSVGQLGNGSFTNSPTPQTVTWLGYNLYPSFVQLAGGMNHTCGLDVMGFVWCWGQGAEGELGNGGTANSPWMVSVHNINDDPNAFWLAQPAIAIAAGAYHTCALLADHTVVCWGHNAYGQLGDGTIQQRSTPVPVAGLKNVVAISGSAFGSCALTAGGGMYCWGRGLEGELGNGTTTSIQPTPTPVLTYDPVTHTTARLGDVRALSAGSTNYHNCAITAKYGTLCWGGNWQGQIGAGASGTNQVWAMPNFPNGGATTVGYTRAPIVALETGGLHTCARTADGRFWCWGDNYYGELGINSAQSSSAPVLNLVPRLNAPRQRLVAGAYDACVLNSNGGTVTCWGWNGTGASGTGQIGMQTAPGASVSGLTNVVALAGGLSYFCALQAGAGQVSCWGYNGQYNLGDGTTSNRTTPVNVLTGPATPLTDVVAIAPGCAVRADSSVWCWGLNSFGQVGNGSTQPAPYATQVPGLSGVVAISGYEQSNYCAVKLDGSIWCWGRNDHGQLGNGSMMDSPVPVQVTGLPTGHMTPILVATSKAHSCAALDGGEAGTWVSCWGRGDHGQLGNGSTMDSPVPVPVGYQITFPPGTVALSVFDHTTCAINNGTLVCWGWNYAGQVGDGTTNDRIGPYYVTNGNVYKKVLEVAQANGATFVLRADGTVWSWGDNSYGVLGIGSTVSQPAPVQLSVTP
jgi:alpha-tubulin suppressor-like RCC1 family protein